MHTPGWTVASRRLRFGNIRIEFTEIFSTLTMTTVYLPYSTLRYLTKKKESAYVCHHWTVT